MSYFVELFLEEAGEVAAVFAFFDCLAFVVLFFAAADADYHFCEAAVVDEDADRDYGHAGVFGGFGDFLDFLFVEQEFAVAADIVVVVRSVEVFGDVHVLDPDGVVGDVAVGVGQRGFTLADCLDFRAGQYDTGGKRVGNFVVEVGSTVFYVDFREFHYEGIDVCV